MDIALDDNGEHATSYYQTIPDIAYLIPELMEEYDSAGWVTVDCLHQMRLHQFPHLIDQWYRNFEAKVGGPLLFVKDTDSNDLFPNAIHFAVMGVATSVLYYSSFTIYLNQMIIDIAEDLGIRGEPISDIGADTKGQAPGYARKVCCSMPYCFDPKKGALGKLISMFPFDAGWFFTSLSKWVNFGSDTDKIRYRIENIENKAENSFCVKNPPPNNIRHQMPNKRLKF